MIGHIRAVHVCTLLSAMEHVLLECAPFCAEALPPVPTLSLLIIKKKKRGSVLGELNSATTQESYNFPLSRFANFHPGEEHSRNMLEQQAVNLLRPLKAIVGPNLVLKENI